MWVAIGRGIIEPASVDKFYPTRTSRYHSLHAVFETLDGRYRAPQARVWHMASEGMTWCRDNPEALAALRVAIALI